jgi:hypothetical protein
MKLTLPKRGTWESTGTPETLECNCRGQNTLHWGILYVIGKLSKCRCRKWARMSHLDIYSISYGKKKGQESKLTVWLLTTKSRESTRLWCVQVKCDTPLEALNEGYKFASDLIPITGLNKELRPRKVAGVQTETISGLLLGSLGIKSHSDVSAVERCREYYMGEGGGFPRIRAVVSLVSLESPMACFSTKVL